MRPRGRPRWLANQDGWKIDGFDDIKIVDRNAYLSSLDAAAQSSFGHDTPAAARLALHCGLHTAEREQCRA